MLVQWLLLNLTLELFHRICLTVVMAPAIVVFPIVALGEMTVAAAAGSKAMIYGR